MIAPECTGKRDCAYFRLGYQEDSVKRKRNLEVALPIGKNGGNETGDYIP
jgi:hypothetical protein